MLFIINKEFLNKQMRLFANIINEEKKRIITINESQALSLLFEAASLGDIYQKYYSQIPEETFRQIVSADPTYNVEKPDKMGKFGKWLLNLYQKGALKNEDLYKAKDYLSTFVKFNAKINQKDINKYSSLPELYKTIEPFIANPEQTTSKSDEVRKIKEGAQKVYEDAKWLVIVPHTQEASCYYGKGTQWCTAADVSDNMFDYYNEKGNLYINILKGTNTKYQFHFETNSFMDEHDDYIPHPVTQSIGLTKELQDFYIRKYGMKAFVPLTTKYDLDDFLVLDNNYCIGGKYYECLYKIDNNKQTFEEICNLDYYYPNEEAEFTAFRTTNGTILVQKYSSNRLIYINFFDKETETFLLPTSGIKEVTNLTNDIAKVVFKDHSMKLYSFDTHSFINLNINGVFNIFPLFTQKHFEEYDNDIYKITSNDRAENGEPCFAIYSSSQGRIISTWYVGLNTISVFYQGKELMFQLLLKKTYDEYNADLLMYDGKIYPCREFYSKSDIILDEYFKNNEY